MRLVTWNINSIRLRIPIIAKLVKDENPDVICLQETKVVDGLFPVMDCEALGYSHLAYSGMKSYNGVAVLSRLPFMKTITKEWCGKSDCRHISVTFESGIELHNFYVPAGGDVPNPETNEKFAHKLQFLEEMTAWFSDMRSKPGSKILVGDLNIAPLETDVWSHKQLLKVVSHTPVEIEKLEAVKESLKWIDAIRHFTPKKEHMYSWWSYRSRDWAASDRGRRLDHVWVTPALEKNLKSAYILRQARGWEKPSDHVPVIVNI
ncbi:MAG: exodeoxyribonuclease III [Rhodospirillaceae bacterium]|nr:exodeoxyribonuclease III [Rhodospirillaceae bacterium]|tara:strand:- start:579 stop:1364 length:786 start_codon:yes stop_codon:yes gene_type:complete